LNIYLKFEIGKENERREKGGKGKLLEAKDMFDGLKYATFFWSVGQKKNPPWLKMWKGLEEA
jgi:hypothetical protein